MPLPSRPSAEPHATDDASTLRILAVCSGNICRSPLLEQLLRLLLPTVSRVGAFEVSSAGTIAREGQRMDPQALAEAERRGVADAGGHRARRLRASMVDEADLIIALATEHRSEIVGLVPRALGRTFTLLEFARLTRSVVESSEPMSHAPGHLPGGASFPATVRALTLRAARSRGMLALHPDTLDIEDPIGRGDDVHRRSAESVERAVRELVHDLEQLMSSTSGMAE